jgi:hypothetical protein
MELDTKGLSLLALQTNITRALTASFENEY